jgi:cysteine-rich repeat protein
LFLTLLAAAALAACGFGDDNGHTGDDGGDDTVEYVCGDGAVDPGEDCDDGDLTGGDGCGATCGVEAGWTCTGEPSACTMMAGSCGDGAISAGEACDDGDQIGGDGCSAQCQVEAGWECSGAPSTCTQTCGNGAMNPGEECDDGDTAGGDGCSIGCAIEAGWECTGTPSTCTPIATACSLVPQSGCTPGSACDLTPAENGDTACRPITLAGTSDDFCAVDTACAAGYTCVGEAAAATCMRFCVDDGGCSGSARCLNALVNDLGVEIPGVTVCTNSCVPLAQTGCPSGLGCLAYNATGGDFTDCEVMGTKADGQTCANSNECQPGSTCASVGTAAARCRSYCAVGGANTCGASASCTGYVNPLTIGANEIGACVSDSE